MTFFCFLITVTDMWRTSDGESIPMDDGVFWVAGRPNSPDQHHCMRTWAQYGHLFDDLGCSNSFTTMCMCETETI